MSRIVMSIEENGTGQVLGQFDLSEHYRRIYNKAIDDMIAIIKEMRETAQAMMWDREENACDRFIKQAEQLKEGGKNDD